MEVIYTVIFFTRNMKATQLYPSAHRSHIIIIQR